MGGLWIGRASLGVSHFCCHFIAKPTFALLLLLAVLCTWPSTVLADSYRYRDGNGMAHYTDNQGFSVKALPSSGHEHPLNRDGVLTRVVEQADGHYLFMLNRLTTPVTLQLQFSDTHNARIPSSLNQALLLAAQTETLIGKVSAKEAGAWRYHYDFSYQYGHQAHASLITAPVLAVGSQPVLSQGAHKTLAYFPSAPLKKSAARAYGPPYVGAKQDLASPVMGRYRIAQGFNGAFSHNKPANRYALDIALAVGTPLYASRAGVVVAAVDHHVGGGLSPEYRGKANYLRVRHSDGSMTLYAHLQTASLLVAKGEQVRLGQGIAASGNTGYTSGPHLHLALQVSRQGQIESIPFTLQGSQPLAGLWLTGAAWGAE